MLKSLRNRFVQLLAAALVIQCAPAFALMVNPSPEKSQEAYEQVLSKRQELTRNSELIKREAENSPQKAEQIRLQTLPLKEVPNTADATQEHAAMAEEEQAAWGSYAFIAFIAIAILSLIALILYSKHAYKNRKLLDRNPVVMRNLDL